MYRTKVQSVGGFGLWLDAAGIQSERFRIWVGIIVVARTRAESNVLVLGAVWASYQWLWMRRDNRKRSLALS